MKVAISRAFKDRLKGHKQSVISLYSPYGDQGHMLYSVSRDGSMKGWDLAKRQITLKLLLDKTVRTSEEKEKEQRQIDAKDDKINANEKSFTSREQIITSVFSEKFLFGSYEDGSINQWSFVNQGEIVRNYFGHQARVSSLALIESKKLLVSCSHDSTIRCWNTETGEAVSVYKTSGPINSLKIGKNGNIQAIVNRNIFYQINPVGNSIVKCIKFQKHSITTFFFQDDMLLFGNIENKVLLYDLKEFNPDTVDKLQQKKIIEGINGWTLSIEFSNGLVYLGCDDRKIRVYRWPQMQQVQELAGHEDGIISMAFADKMFYSGSYDHSIRSWDLREMMQRISEREFMIFEDLQSKKYQVYYNVVFKNKKRKLPAKKKK